MTLNNFNVLPYEQQLVSVFDTGCPLMVRWEKEFAFKLYELPSRFFVEMEFNTASSNIVQLRSFSYSNILEDYEASIQLPDWLA